MYIGNDLQIAHPSYKIIDDISSGFNGSQTSFALQVNGATPVPFPISTQQVMISVNGVVQEPDPNGNAGFKLLGSNIVFSSAPANGHAFFGVINAGADYVTAGSEFPDGSATAPSFTFQDDQDTGWYRNASGDVGYSSNGSAILNFDGNGLTIAAGKGLTVDTSTLKVDAANNRVGIGLTAPATNFHVKAASPILRLEDSTDPQGTNGSIGKIEFYGNDGSSGGVDVRSYIQTISTNSIGNAHALVIGLGEANAAPAEKIRILGDGKVGIGLTAPEELLHLKTASGNCKLRIDAAATPSIDFYEAGTRNSDIMVDHSSNELIITNRQNASINFRTNGANERARIDLAGRLLVGHTASTGEDRIFQIVGTSSDSSSAQLIRHSADTAGSKIDFTKSRNATKGSNTILQAEDSLGDIIWRGDDGTDLNSEAAKITAVVDGTPGSNDMPGRLTFWTSADGSASPTERMRITSSGAVKIGTTIESASAATNLVVHTPLSSSNANSIEITQNTNGANKAAAGIGIAIANGGASTNAADLYFSTATNGSLGERLRIKENGALGIAGANYGTSGQVLTSGGSSAAPSWTSISSAPEISGTASGSIAQDKAVYVKTDGTLAQVVATYANGSVTSGNANSRLRFGSTDDYETYTALGYNPVADHLFFAGDQKNASRGYLQTIVLTAAGEIPTSGNCSNAQFHNGRVEGLQFVWDSTNEKLALLYQKQSNNYSCIRTVSSSGGCNATLGTELQYTTQSAQLNAMSRGCFNPTTGTIFQIGATISGGGLAIFELEWTGANYTFRNRYVILSSGTVNSPFILHDPVSEKLVVLYQLGSALKAQSITPTGSSTSRSYTAGSAITIGSTYYQEPRAVYDTNENKVLWVASDADTSGFPRKAGLFTVNSSSGALTAVGSTTDVGTTGGSREGMYDLTWDPQVKNAVFFMNDTSTSSNFGNKRLTVSGNTISVGAWSSLYVSNMYGGTDDTSGVYMKNGKMSATTTGGHGGCWGFTFTSSTTSTPMTTSNFVGFAKAAATNGNSVDVKVVGNTTTQSGLTSGSKYYVQGSGALGTTADTPSVEAGTALSSTKLLIKG